MSGFRGWYRAYLSPAGTLAGTIIGAGIFSLPYVFARAGALVGFFYLILGTITYATVHLMYARIILATPGRHRFVGYAKIYGGTAAYWLAVLIQVVQAVFVLTIYLVLAPQFITLAFPQVPFLLALLLFWVAGSVSMFLRIRAVALFESLVTGGMVAIILFLLGLGIFGGNLRDSLSLGASLPFFFLPLAPVLFSMSGIVAIPALVDYLNDVEPARRHKSLRTSIVLGTIIPAAAYLAFVVAVTALSPAISEDSVSGLASVLSFPVLAAIGFLGIISLISSYLMIGLNTLNILRLDLRWPSFLRIGAVTLGPLVIYFSGFQNFLSLVRFTGGIFVALEGLLVIFLWWSSQGAAKGNLHFRIGLVAATLATLSFAAALMSEVVSFFP